MPSATSTIIVAEDVSCPSSPAAEPAAAVAQPLTPTARKVRKFMIQDDIRLLKEVVTSPCQNAFEASPTNSACWQTIAENVVSANTKLEGLTARAAKDRAEKVTREGRAKENWRARQSGTAEQYGLKEKFLLDAVALLEEHDRKKKDHKAVVAGKKEKEETEKLLAEKAREAAALTLSEKPKKTKSGE